MGPILNVYYKAENHYIGADEHETLIEAFRTGIKKVVRKAIERDIVRGGMNPLRYFDEQDAAAKRA